MKNKNKIQEGALDVGIQSYSTDSKSNSSKASKSDSKSTSSTTAKSTSGFKQGSRVFTNQQNLKKTIDALKGKDVDVVVTDGVKDKAHRLEYVSEVVDDKTGDISKPFTIGAKNYQMVRAMGPDRKIVMGVYAFDEKDESGNCRIYHVNEFEGIAKAAINELGVQEPEGPEAATLNPYPEKDAEIKETKEKKETEEMKPNFEGFKHFIVNEKSGKVRKFKTIQELAKAQMAEDEKYMGIKEFKKFVDKTLFGAGKKHSIKEENIETTGQESDEEMNIKAKKLMDMISDRIPSGIIKTIRTPIAQREVIAAFSEMIGVPRNGLGKLIAGLKDLAKTGTNKPTPIEKGAEPTPAATSQPVTERRIIKVKDLK